MTGNRSSFRLNLAPLGIPTLIIADDPQLAAAARATYAHWLTEAPLTPPRIELRLELGSAVSAERVSLDIDVKGSILRLSGRGAEGMADAATGRGNGVISPQLTIDPPALADVLDTLLLFLLTRDGRTPVHAAAFMVGDLALVLAGPSGSGKSMLALAAARRGLPVMSDDTVYVQHEPSFTLWGFPRAIHVFPCDAPPGDHPVRERSGKAKATIPLSSPALRADRCALILLERGTSVELRSVDSGAAFDRLMNLEPGFDLLEGDSRRAFDLLASRGVWSVTLSDDPCEAIDLLVSRVARGHFQDNPGRAD